VSDLEASSTAEDAITEDVIASGLFLSLDGGNVSELLIDCSAPVSSP
jgi:hypothetical protein